MLAISLNIAVINVSRSTGRNMTQHARNGRLNYMTAESSHLGDCPICFLPLSIDPQKSTFMGCCSKIICQGCAYANTLRQREEKLEPACAFCRHRLPKTQKESEMNKMKRVEKNDPFALQYVGVKHKVEGDHEKAFKYWAKAADLGDAIAHYYLSIAYREGKGVEKDEKMEIYHLEKAAIAGHHLARYNLAMHEGGNGRYERAVKHLIISANLGHDKSIQKLKENYTDGHVSKEDFAAALRAYQAAMVAMKSPQREAAEAARR
mmetsp:Transcript_26475/g.40020  ORF Transcript_26475/g.40020 Transcript_26475/m.40020 type:complete len:263 (+) Transcript_26475:44-832(+)